MALSEKAKSQEAGKSQFTQVNKKSHLYRRAIFHEHFDRMLREEEYRALKTPARKQKMGIKQYVAPPEKAVSAVDISQFKGDIDQIEDAIAGMIDRGRLDLSELQNENFDKIHEFKLKEYYEVNDPANNLKVKVEDFGFVNYANIDVAQDQDIALLTKHEVYTRENQNMYMVKDLKFADIYA